MALNSTDKKNDGNRSINYLGKDFTAFRNNLIEYAKTYYPKTYSDFNESSPGMMFIEMASYLGDILSYYIDDTMKESLMVYAEDKKNVISLAQYLGYKPKVTTPALVKLTVYQTVPNKGSGDFNSPDDRFFLRVREGMVVTSKNGVQFRTTELLDFSDPDDREISVYKTDDTTGEPILYLVQKKINAISAELRKVEHIFGSPERYSRIELPEENIIEIMDIRDDQGTKWYEVPYLAQETIYVDTPIISDTDEKLTPYKDTVPNILKLLKTSRRFVTQVQEDNSIDIIFGGGNATDADETLIPNLKNVGLGMHGRQSRLMDSFDPSNFLKDRSYGQAPSNTTLTVTYLVGGGVESNVPVGEINEVQSIEFDDDYLTFTVNDTSETRVYRECKASISVDNEEPATGGRGAETVDEIRENALANFGSQNRAVTSKDYQVRVLSMPPKYGGVAKAFCAPYDKADKKSYDINLYILGYDSSKSLSPLNEAVKENIKTYLGEYRMLTDGVNIMDGFVVNIGVDFEIRVYGGYNKREVMLKCTEKIKEYFNIDNWSFNMPINISDIEVLLAGIEGVASVPKCEIVNKCLGEYSKFSYNISEATRGKMVYPPLDPTVFEIKFPNKDIRGKVI